MKRYLNLNRAGAALLVAASLTLAACGGGSGGGGGGGGGGGPAPTTSITGKAADGYLVEARVCLDRNANKQCDPDEPTTMTGSGGRFTLEVTATEAEAYPIVVEVIEDVTLDEDTDQRVDKPYVLTAPAGKTAFVSPLTTAVQGLLEQNPALDPDTAAAAIRQSLSAAGEVDLFKDYVEAKKTEPAYKRVHKVAQVAAKVLAETQAAIEEAAQEQNIDTTNRRKDVIALVFDQLVGQLNEAARKVDQAGDKFDIDAVKIDVDQTLITDLAAELDRVREQAELAIATTPDILREGAYRFMGDKDDGYRYVEYKTDDENMLNKTSYVHDGTEWVLDPVIDSSIWLTSDGEWILEDDDFAWTVSPAANAAATMRLPEGAGEMTMNAARLDVAGKKIHDYLRSKETLAFAAGIPADAKFSPGAAVYRVSFVNQIDSYEIVYYTDDEDMQNLGLCLYPGENCNFTFGYHDDGPAKNFDELIYPTPESATDGGFTDLGDDLIARFIKDGIVQITDKAPGGEAIENYDGRWKEETVRDQKLIVLESVPEQFVSRLWESGRIFYTIHEDYVRVGSFSLKGDTEVFDGFWFNRTAMEDIKNKFIRPPAP